MNNILLFDEHTVVRRGITTLLNEYFPSCCIEESASEQQTRSLVKQKQYCIILLEFKTTSSEFGSLVSWIRMVSPDTYILVFSGHPEDLYGLLCLQAGAHGFLSKSAPCDEILHAFRKAWNQEKYMSVRLSERLTDNFTKRIPTENPFHSLSERETEIAIQIEKGDSITEISQRLRISYSTVNTYKRRIFEKLNVKSILQLAHLIQAFENHFSSKKDDLTNNENSHSQKDDNEEEPHRKAITYFKRA
jgi:two-component system invasion response regulator UvrY